MSGSTPLSRRREGRLEWALPEAPPVGTTQALEPRTRALRRLRTQEPRRLRGLRQAIERRSLGIGRRSCRQRPWMARNSVSRSRGCWCFCRRGASPIWQPAEQRDQPTAVTFVCKWMRWRKNIRACAGWASRPESGRRRRIWTSTRPTTRWPFRSLSTNPAHCFAHFGSPACPRSLSSMLTEESSAGSRGAIRGCRRSCKQSRWGSDRGMTSYWRRSDLDADLAEALARLHVPECIRERLQRKRPGDHRFYAIRLDRPYHV